MGRGGRQVMGLVVVCLVVLLVGCGGVYTKVEKLANGQELKYEVTYEKDWWEDIGSPDMMGIKRERTFRDGVLVYDSQCEHVPTRPDLLRCGEVKQ